MSQESSSAHNLDPIKPRQVYICQGTSCRRFGSRSVLKAFQTHALTHVEIIPCGCLRQCGNGPMVIILPEKSWYWRVTPEQVALLQAQHLQENHPVTSLLYPYAP